VVTASDLEIVADENEEGTFVGLQGRISIDSSPVFRELLLATLRQQSPASVNAWSRLCVCPMKQIRVSECVSACIQSRRNLAEQESPRALNFPRQVFVTCYGLA
jgi:hypothetical protein